MDNPKINTNRMWEHLNNAQLIRYLLVFALGWAIVPVLAYCETVLIVFLSAELSSQICISFHPWLGRGSASGFTGLVASRWVNAT